MIEIKTCPICNSNSFHPYHSCIDYTVSHETFNLIQCSRCQLIVTSPRPENEDLGRYYISSDYISHSNKATTIVDKLYILARSYTLKWKTELVKKYSPTADSINILDYGCGTGNFLSACYSKKWSVSGIEPSIHARENCDTAIKTLIHESISNIPNTEFDVITLWHVLEHIPDPNTVLVTLIQKLKENGTLFIAVPNCKSWDGKFYKEHWAGYDVPRHLWHFTQQNISVLAKRLSLQVIDTIPMKLDAYYVSLLSEKYKNPNKKLTNLFSGFFKGLISNLKARNTHEYSSLIYILKKT